MNARNVVGALFACLCGLPLRAAAGPAHHVYAMVVPGLTARDLARPEMADLGSLVPKCAVGWMVARTAGYRDADLSPEALMAAEMASLGAGARAAPPSRLGPLRSAGNAEDAYWAVSAAQEAASWHAPEEAHVGHAPDGADAVSRLRRAILNANRSLDYPVHLGALGSALHKSGWRTAVVGDAGVGAVQVAAPILLAMDAQGRVDLADTGPSTVVRDASMPYGIKANLDAFGVLHGSDFGVYAFGDLARAKEYASLCFADQAQFHISRACARLDRQILAIWRSLQPGDYLIVLGVPYTRSALYEDLAPVLLMGTGVTPGLLTSPSTQRLGVVANTDFLPTVLTMMGAPVPGWAEGRAMVSFGPSRTMAEWLALHRELAHTARLQEALGGLPSVQLVLVLVIAADILGLFAGPKCRLASVMSAGAIVGLPLALIVLPILQPARVATGMVLTALGLLAFGLAAVHPSVRPRFAGTVLASLGLLLTADMATGGHLLSRAWMSYSVTVGARFYGIGNEYGAALLAAVLLTWAGLLRWGHGSTSANFASRRLDEAPRFGPRSLGLPLVLTVLGIVVGAPMLGSNFGCALAFFITAVAAALQGVPSPRRWWWLSVAVLGFCLVVGLVVASDLVRPPERRTHVGRVFTHSADAIVIARRKLALNLRLAGHSPWSAAGIAAAWVLVLKWRRRKRMPNDSGLRQVSVAYLWGTGAILALNDSGVVAAAEMLLLASAAQWLSASHTVPADSAGGASAPA